MEDQELRKLKRVELLEIMVEQGRAVGELRQQMEEQEKHIQEMEAELQEKTETIERLKEKLNKKDEEMQKQVQQISIVYKRLRNRLNEKDDSIRSLQAALDEERAHPIVFEKTDSLDDAAEELNRIFQDAQKAATQYLEMIKNQ